ncbi:MAG: hypothetical protein QM756_31775 [Polyangiaceae bacterium]
MSFRGCQLAALLLLLAGCVPLPRRHAPVRQHTEESPLYVVRAQRWQLSEAARAPSPLERQASEAVHERWRRIVSNDAFACVAREFAVYFAKRKSPPDELLAAWIGGKCGAAATVFDTAWWPYPSGSVGAAFDSEQIAGILGNAAPYVPAATTFGVGISTVGSEGVLMLVFAHPRATLALGDASPEGDVRVSGTFVRTPHRARAVVNQGRYGFKDCALVPSVVLPDFAFDCRVGEAEAEAWVDVVVQWDERPLEGAALNTLAQRKRSFDAEYERPYVAIGWQRDRGKGLLRKLNEMRREVGVAPLEYLEEQSREADAKMPAYFGAITLGTAEDSDAIYGELSAGLHVPGPIRWGVTVPGFVRDGNAGDWLAARLQSPNARARLFEPSMTHAAVAVSDAANFGCGAMISLYELFSGVLDLPLAEALFAHLKRRREDDGFQTTSFEPPQEIIAMAAEVASGRAKPDAALKLALVRANANGKRRLDGAIVDVSRADLVPVLHYALLEREVLACAVVVTHWKAPNEPWARTLGFVVFEVSDGEPKAGTDLRRAPSFAAMRRLDHLGQP